MSNDAISATLQYIVEHVFMPPKVPDQENEEMTLRDTELLGELSKVAAMFKDTLSQNPQVGEETIGAWDIITRMLRSMETLRSAKVLTKSSIEAELRSMKVGDVLPILVSAQNAGVIFRKPSADMLTFESFELSLPNEVVTGTIGKIVVQYPVNSRLAVPSKDELLSTLANAISFLASQHLSETIPVLMKAGVAHENSRDTASPRYITEALAGFLRGVGPTNNPSTENSSTVFIQKRIDDRVLIGTRKVLPWRRSSMWLLLRVSLQTTLEELRLTGGEGYKSFQAYFMAYLLQQCTINFDVVEDDVVDTMNKKLARRLWKMKDLIESSDSPTLTFAGTVITDVSTALKARWEEARKRCVNVVDWTAPTQKSIEESLVLSLQVNQKYLRSVVERTQKLASSTSQYDDAITRRKLASECPTRLDVHTPALPTSINTAELDIGLMDFEFWVEKQLSAWSTSFQRSENDCVPLSALIEDYSQKALRHYAQSPERISVFWLTVVELWVALDKLVVIWNPLMKEFSPEIPDDFLDPLLLPSASHLKRMAAVESYIRNRQAASTGASLFGDINSPQSFQNLYFVQSQELQAKKTKIEKWGREEREKTLQKMVEANNEYNRLVAEAGNMEHQYFQARTRYGDYVSRHDRWCYKCSLPSRTGQLRTPLFEDPLPTDPYHANPIVFELQCPQPFGIWRETTYQLLLRAFSHSETSNSSVHKLKDYVPLSGFCLSKDRRLSIASSAACVVKAVGATCIPPARPEEVVFGHAGIYKLMYDGGWLQARGGCTLRGLCTLSLDVPYTSLKPFIQDTAHSPNFVIASQDRCPISINLGEYLAFGLLRAGNRIQLWNAVRALLSDSLSFNEGGVHSLLVQTIWQAGPNKDTSAWYRDAHMDLLDTAFAMEMLSVLNESLERVGESGREILHLATLTVLATRLLSFSQEPKVRQECMTLLDTAREKASSWMALAETEAAQSTSDDSARLQHKKALIAIVWRLTFDVDADVLQSLSKSPANIRILLFTSMTIAADSTQPSSLPYAIRLLLRRNDKLSHRLEPYIVSALGISSTPLDEATYRVWNGYQRGSQWQPLDSNGLRWWGCTTDGSGDRAPRSVYVNILSGVMLVDGKTPDRLPASYIAHEAYQQLLGNSVSLQCHPSTMRGLEYEASYQGMQLHFAMIDNSLIIRIRRAGTIEEYIPRSRISGDIPSNFLHETQHWYIEESSRNVVEFRPLKSSWSAEIDKNWALELKSAFASGLRGTLRKNSSSGVHKAMDPHSQTFKRLHNAVKGVEPTSLDIVVVIIAAEDTQAPILNLILPNHNLSFFVNPKDQLESRSFPGYILDSNQDIKCLYGLVDCLVLCDSSASRRVRKVVIPRGRIEVTQSLQQRHPTVHIKAVSKGGFHVYEVDTLVGRLIGSGTIESDLFLVQLHAFTASHCLDPLTNRTGTEEALRCLESASLRSHHQHSKLWRAQIEQIASLSPRRTYYPHWSKSMEQIHWYPNLPVASQHPEFEKQIVEILSYWSTIDIQKLNTEYTRPLQSAPGMTELSRRAAMRELTTTSSHSAFRKNYEEDYKYTYRDVTQSPESQKREASAYQVAFCTQYLAMGLPACTTLRHVSREWGLIEPRQVWSWVDLPQWFFGSISTLWSTLYKLCCVAPRGQEAPRFNIALALSMLSYKDAVPFPILGTLVAILRDPEFQHPTFSHPIVHALPTELGCEFKDTEVFDHVKEMEIGFDNSEDANLENAPGRTHYERLKDAQDRYNGTVTREVNQTVSEVKRWWLDTRNPRASIVLHSTSRLRGLESLWRDTLQPLLEHWTRNKQFLEHLIVVDRRLCQLSHLVVSPTLHQHRTAVLTQVHGGITEISVDGLIGERLVKDEDICVPSAEIPTTAKRQPSSIHEQSVSKLKSLMGSLGSVLHGRLEERYKDDLDKSMHAFSSSPPTIEAQIPTEKTLSAFRQTQELYHDIVHTQIVDALSPRSTAEKLLADAGLWPRVTAQTLLSRLSLQKRSNTNKRWVTVISLYANHIISVQRSRRLCHYGAKNMVMEYNREILHGRERQQVGDPEWLDWLLVEIDADICIRSDQMDVAKAMIAPKGGNTVMQLNMGEGKSSVIVPIVAATLANTIQLVRVVVLKPQSKLQLNLLRGRLARLANRRIICLPFSRDLKVDISTATNISRILEDCRAEGGIWLCQPEHLLSFKLLGLDLAMRTPQGHNLGSEMIKCQLWMQEHARDILDESDEILHTRHQLVYTVGDQASFDAAPTRWELVQELLALVQSRLTSNSSPHFLVAPTLSIGQFPLIRMMADEGKELFHEIARIVVFEAAIPSIRMANLSTLFKDAALCLLTQCEMHEDDLANVTSLRLHCEKNDENLLWQSLLLVRGLIAFNILPLALQNKRWSVDYGHDLRRSQLAVPYRAKDSPSLRSDFAHPEVLILLTCITYYYNGLDDSMIIRAVKELLKADNPELIYEQWISPHGKEVPKSLQTLAGVNVEDEDMIVRSLHPFLRHNKGTIDFFLNRCVFPKEAKEFPYKMSTSGWDLAMRKRHLTTGFSGTNDSRFLLPTSIVQEDSTAQLHTNATVLAHILQDDNATVKPIGNNPTSEQVLDLIFRMVSRPTVLLDVGAQILDSSNADLVKRWLFKYEESNNIKAAVFFDNDDNMCIMERDGTVQAFADSPYATRLDECLVYLDDAHTRGTDLKLPRCTAAVTLGPRLPKDKIVQGCMRMRKLGSEHSLVFLAPDEVISEVKKVTGADEATVVSSHVLQWAMKETCRQLQGNVANWKMQGYEFAARQYGWERMRTEIPAAKETQALFCQQESRSLAQLYGVEERKLARTQAEQRRMELAQNPTLDAIDRHCELFEPFSSDEARAQEQQEVELVQEQEVEREVERPPAATPATHSVHPHVEYFATTGLLVPNSPAFRTVQRSFEHTSLVFPAGGTSAFSNLIVTDDFYHTIQRTGTGPTSSIDDFLRPVEWVVTSQGQQGLFLVLFSPYEVNELFPVFRTSTKAKLHLFAPRTKWGMRSLEDMRLFNLPTNIPRSPISSLLAQQLNLYSGTLYLRDPQSYHDICRTLRLRFGDIAAAMADMGVINSNGFVKDQRTREELGFIGEGFEEDPVQFLRKLFHLRRNGRSFLPSHLGQILFGVGLPDSAFKQE